VNCYVCDRAGRATVAVALCKNCEVALCREHLDEELLSVGPGGASFGCGHDPVRAAQAAAAAGD
jgi:hypothetical protein